VRGISHEADPLVRQVPGSPAQGTGLSSLGSPGSISGCCVLDIDPQNGGDLQRKSLPAGPCSADRQAIQRLLEQQSELSLQNAERLEKERIKLENLYDYRQKALADKLESVTNVLNRVSESTDPTVRRIIPAWQKNLENVMQLADRTKVEREYRLNELRGREQISAQHEMISASFVDIVPATHIPTGDMENQLV